MLKKLFAGVIASIVSPGIFAADATQITIPGFTPPGSQAVIISEPATEITTVKTTTTEKKIDYEEEQRKFVESLKTCSAGKFVVKQLNPLMASGYGDIETDEIGGMINGKCHLNRMFYQEDDKRLKEKPPEKTDNLTPTTTETTNATPEDLKNPKLLHGQECDLSPAMIQVMTSYTDQQGVVAADQQSFYSQLILTECQLYVIKDGKKLMEIRSPVNAESAKRNHKKELLRKSETHVA